DQAAARGDDRPLVLVQHALQSAALEAPEGILAVHREHLAELGAGFLLDFAVELDERQAQAVREPAPERRLACAAQADERDAPAARGALFFAHQVLYRDAHGARDLAQQQHRDVAAARLELGEIALGHAAGERERLPRHAVLGAPGAHALAEAGAGGVRPPRTGEA